MKARKLFYSFSLREKKIPEAIKIIKQTAPNAFITVNDIKSMVGGFIK